MTWSIRRASLRDYDDVAELCRVAVGEDDYAIQYLNRAILRHVVHLAFDGKGRLVGMMVSSPAVDGSRWLRMARTHPDVRRQGVASAILDTIAGLARAGGVPALRLWTEASNRAAMSSATSAGFHEVGRFTRVVGPAARGPRKANPRAFDENLWDLVRSSPILAKGHGYASHDWTFVPAERPIVFVLAAKGHFFAWERHLLALAQPDPEPEAPLSFTAWAGEPDELFREACRQAAALGRREATTFIPHDRDLLAAARRSGFRVGTWGREAVVFEKKIEPARTTKRSRPTFGELAAGRDGHSHDELGWARWNA